MSPKDRLLSRYFKTDPFPEIAEHDYPEFAKIISDIPRDYDDWITQQRQAIQKLEQVGLEPVPIPVRLFEFKGYCVSRQLAYSSHSLSVYARENSPRRDFR